MTIPEKLTEHVQQKPYDKPANHSLWISVDQAILRWLAGQDDARLPSFEDIQTEIGQLKLRPEEENLVRSVAAMREKIEELP